MKSLSAALLLIALLSAPAFGQDACSVDLVFPQGTIQLSSGECYIGFACAPYPIGCSYWQDLVEPVSVALVDPPLGYTASVRSVDAVRTRTSFPDFTIVQEWRGTLGWNGYTWALDFSDRPFSDGFDPWCAACP